MTCVQNCQREAELEKIIQKLEDHIEVLKFKVNALQTQLASHGIKPVVK